MLCEKCNKNEATVHVTNIVNGKKSEQNLCSTCAHQDKPATPYSSFFDVLHNDFFKNMIYPDYDTKAFKEERCSGCGLTYSDFNRSGKFGCPQCYDTFSERIEDLVKRIQGSATYEGKVPSRGTGVFRMKHAIKRLRQELSKAVIAEDFERAMELRDEIKALEVSLEKGIDMGDVKSEKINKNETTHKSAGEPKKGGVNND